MKTHLGKESNLKPLPHQSSLIWGEVWPWQCFILFMVQNLFGTVAHRYPFDYHKVGLCYSKPKGRKSLFFFYLRQFFFSYVLASSKSWGFQHPGALSCLTKQKQWLAFLASSADKDWKSDSAGACPIHIPKTWPKPNPEPCINSQGPWTDLDN